MAAASIDEYTISDLVDIAKLEATFANFSRLTGFAMGMATFPDGKILFLTGDDICTRFHRGTPDSAKVCHGGFVALTTDISEPGQVTTYRCEHGLTDGATPVVVRGVRLATIVAGHVSLEPIDLEHFERNAQKYRYEREPYLTLARRIPVVTADHLRAAVSVLADFAVLVAEAGLRNLQAVEAERRLQHAQRLESLGRFASGIAHDFNNLLVGVLGNTQLAAELLDPQSPAAPHLQSVAEAAARMGSLARQILTYSGMGSFTVEAVDVSRSITNLIPLLHPPGAESVVVRLELGRDLPPALVNSSMLDQVVANLVGNAAEACGDREVGVGEVIVRTSLARAGSVEIRDPQGALLPAADYVCIEVQDNGGGMSEEVRERIFEPFFTTKFAGRGLGLSVVAGIAKSHGGTVELSSRLGEGTTFRFYLPAAPNKPLEVQAAPPRPARSLEGLRGRVLVVDDEVLVRRLVKSVLEREGIEVVAAASGGEAIELAERVSGIDAVILDSTMPGMSGAQTLAELRRIHPGLPVIMVSGFESDNVAMDGALEFLHKPFEIRTLTEAVARTLSSTRG